MINLDYCWYADLYEKSTFFSGHDKLKLVPKTHNIECHNLQIPLQVKPAKVSWS